MGKFNHFLKLDMVYKNIKIGVINYEVGNYSSLITSLKKLHYSTILTNDKALLEECDILILPGVGSFHQAINKLKKYKLINFISTWAFSKKPIIGICLGMQLLADYSYEGGKKKGLGIIPGIVTNLKEGQWHIGWNEIEINRFEKIQKMHKDFYYFNHSFSFETDSQFIHAIASSNQDIPAVIVKHNTVGVQFHPEKSHDQGLNFLDYLVKLLTSE